MSVIVVMGFIRETEPAVTIQGTLWCGRVLHTHLFLHTPTQIPSNPSPLLTIFDFDPEEVARQMTVIDFSLFAKIKPAELLNQVCCV